MQKTNNEFVETVLMAIPADMLDLEGPNTNLFCFAKGIMLTFDLMYNG